MAALTRKRNRKTLKQQQRQRIKKHTTRRLKGRLLRTRVKKNKTRKLQRGGLKDNDILFKTIDNIIKENPEYTAFITKYKQIIKKSYLKYDKTINYDAIKENNKLFKEFNAIMTNKIINDNFKKCLNDCPDDDALAKMLKNEEGDQILKKNQGWGDNSPLYFTDFLTLDIELDKIKEARIIFDERYNKSEDDLVRKKKFITVLLQSPLNVVAVDVRLVKDQPSAIKCFTDAFKITLDALIQNDLEFKSDNEPADKTKTTRPYNNREANTVAALQSLPESVNPYEVNGDGENDFGFGRPESPTYDFASSSNRD